MSRTESEPDNIICFDQAVVHILGTLYLEFPKRVALIDPKEWQENSPIPEHCRQDYTLGRNLYSETLLWLVDEGFIVCDESRSHFSNVRLSSKGLTLLRRQPEGKKSSFGRMFAEAIAEEGSKILASRAWATVAEFFAFISA